MTEQVSEVNALAAQVNATIVHQIPGLTAPVVVVPEGYKVADLEYLQPEPSRIAEKVIAHSVDALIDYIKEFHTIGTKVFFCTDTRTVRAALDYHQPADPSRCTHEVIYTAKLSREWQEWTSFQNKFHGQIQFAEFIEEHVADVVEPAGAQLLEIALKFSLIRKSVFGSAARLQSGEFQFQFTNENEKGSIEVPETITLGIPPLHHGQGYKLKARLRYRLNEGLLTLQVKLIDEIKAVEHAFSEVVQKVREAFPSLQVIEATVS